MFESKSLRLLSPAAVLCLTLAALLLFPCLSPAQDTQKKSAAVPVVFLPPPIEGATYSVGIYEAKGGKLVRRLAEAAPQSAFTVGLNGLITSWDGKDDNGKAVPPGRYAARGYAAGPMEVEGVAILGNDWAEDDENLRVGRVEAITILPGGMGLAVLAEVANGPYQVICYESEKGTIRWHKSIPVDLSTAPHDERIVRTLEAGGDTIFARVNNRVAHYQIKDGADHPADVFLPTQPAHGSLGQNGTVWKIEDGILTQYSSKGEVLRGLLPKTGEPIPVAVTAANDSDRLYLLEEAKGWQRVRGLVCVETKEENGKPVSSWQTFFERDIRPPDPSFGLEGAVAGMAPSPVVEIVLAENPLSPGKPEHARLTATFDEKGSYLATGDGLRLRQISQRANLRAVKLAKDKAVGALTFFQSDSAAWDEFSIKGAKEIAGFDAGEFEMTTGGLEKPADAKAAPEPDL